MTEFLLLLGKLNLAMGAAIIVAFLLRRPLRAWFGAPVAYALWLLVPVACLASLLPPRTYALPPAYVMPLHNPAARNPPAQNPAGQYPAVRMPVTKPIAQPAPRIPEQLAEHIAPVQSMISAKTASLDSAFLDYAALLFAAWVLGMVLMALYLVRLQIRFHATMRLGEAGPVVLGFFRPRLVMPDNFQEQYTAPEQAAILAHERVHLARQDARINALAALLRCLCWFNPLIHLGAAAMRIDQELACDATALAGTVSRRDYANALLKSQMMVTLLPLGCNWPGSQHPLIERIALLKRKRPGTARRIAGTGLVIVAATCAGVAAWAAQPPVPAKSISAPHLSNQIAMNTPPAMIPTPGANAGEPVADANPVQGGDAAKNRQAPPEMPKAGSAQAQSALPAIQVPDQKIDLELNEATGAELAKAAADASSTLSDQAVARQMAASGTTPESAASPSTKPSPDAADGVAATVNGESISDYELRQRMALFMATSGLHPNAEHMKRIRSQVLERLKDEKLHLQEAVKEHITVSPDEVDKAIATLLAQNHLTIEQLRSALGAAGASELALRSEIAAQIAWQKTVHNQHSDRANTDPAEVAATAPASPGSATGIEPRLITEGALGCLIGLAPDGCEVAVFEYPSVERRTITHCAAEYVHGWLDNCPNAGALESVEFLGTNAAGADVYAVKYMSMTSTYIIPPPGPDGRIATHCTFGRPPASAFQGACTDGVHCPARCFSNVDSSVARVTSPPDRVMIVYTRPAAGAETDVSAAAAATAGPAPLAVSSPAPAQGVRPEIEQSLNRAEDLFKQHEPAAAMESLKAVTAVPDLNSDEKHRVAIVRSFITPYSARESSADFNDNLISRGGTDFPFRPPVIVTPN